MLNKEQILQLNCYVFNINCRKIRIYNARNINYNFVIIVIMQRDNALTKKKIHINVLIAF